MNPANTPEFLLDAFNYECAWNHPQVKASDPRYEPELLSLLPHRPEKCWWRPPYSFSFSEFSAEQEVSALREALTNLFAADHSVQILSGTLELQLIARSSLRLGAWKLLQKTLGYLLFQLRSHCPSPQRMSRACGLLAEWALADLNYPIAMIYGQESLVWGGEPHRIRSYLAYAQASESKRDSRAEIDLLLSTEAVNRHSHLSERKGFSHLHAYRIACLQSIATNTRFPGFENWEPSTESASSPVHLAHCAFWATQTFQNNAESSAPPIESLKLLRNSGRWRDRLILSQLTAHPLLSLSADESSFLHELDKLSELFPVIPSQIPDGPYLADLNDQIFRHPVPKPTLQAFLSCI